MDRLNYNQLYYFYVIASQGSIKKACEKLHLTQPTLSAQLKTLEESIGKELFQRKHRKLILTDDGKKVFSQAEKIFKLGNELLIELASRNSPLRNEVRIGVITSLPNTLVSEFTAGLWRSDNIAAHITHGSPEELKSQLDANELDIILTDIPFSNSKRYRSMNISNQKIAVVGSKKFQKLKKDFPESLNETPFLVQKNGQLRDDLEFFFNTNGIHPDFIGSIDNSEVIQIILEKGICISALPLESVKQALKQKRLFLLGEIHEVKSQCWATVSSMDSENIMVKQIINNFLSKKSR